MEMRQLQIFRTLGTDYADALAAYRALRLKDSRAKWFIP